MRHLIKHSIIMILAILPVMVFAKKSDIIVDKGFVNLSETNFSKTGLLKLNGNWEFYWNQYLKDSVQFEKSNPNYIEVPSTWNSYLNHQFKSKAQGYAAYRALIKADTIQDLSLKFLNAATACQIFIDNQLVHKSGNPESNLLQTIPSYKPAIINFTPDNKTFEIIIHVANFHHKKGGLWEPLILGTQEKIKQYHNQRVFLEIFLVGCILIMSIFHFIISVNSVGNKSIFYFAVFCLMIAIKLAVTGEFIIYMINDFAWHILVRTDYLSFYIAILSFLLLIKELYPKEVHNKAVLLLTVITTFFVLSVIVLKPLYFSHGMIYHQLITMFFAIYVSYVLIKALIYKGEGATRYLIGFMLLFICYFHDFLNENAVINSVALTPVGITIFILFQASVLSSRIRKTLAAIEGMSVILKKQNKEYASLNNEYKIQNEQLKIAKDKAEESDRLKSMFLANLSHEIRTPMNSIVGFSDVLRQGELKENDRVKFANIIKERGEQLLAIISDIINISKIETDQVEIQKTPTVTNNIINSSYRNYVQLNDNLKVIITKHTPLTSSKSTILTDPVKLKQIIDNLMSNAIKFTSEGYINLGYELKNGFLEFFVQDDGIGIDKSDTEIIFDRFAQSKNSSDKVYDGTGLGLSIAKGYVEKMGGTIWVESEIDKGSIFKFTIPYDITT